MVYYGTLGGSCKVLFSGTLGLFNESICVIAIAKTGFDLAMSETIVTLKGMVSSGSIETDLMTRQVEKASMQSVE